METFVLYFRINSLRKDK